MVIFVKSFALKDLLFAQRASEAGIAVVLDLCDNIFVPNYSVKSPICPPKSFRPWPDMRPSSPQPARLWRTCCREISRCPCRS